MASYLPATPESLTVDLSEKPIWILSSYGPGKNPPCQLIDGKDVSFEEARLMAYRCQAEGNPGAYEQEWIRLNAEAETQIRNIMGNIPGAINFMAENQAKRDSVIRYKLPSASATGTPPSPFAQSQPQQNPSNPFGAPASASQPNPFGQPAFGQPSQPTSAFGAPSPFAATAAASTPQPTLSAFGQPAFGQTSSPQSAFGKPAQPAFGQPAFGQSAFSQPSAPQSAFGKPAFGQPTFGQSAFGQPQQQPQQQQQPQPQPQQQPQQQQQPQPQTQQPQQPQQSAFGTASVFGGAQPKPAFGQTAFGQPAFGQTSLGGNTPSPFAAAAAAQSHPQASANPFGGYSQAQQQASTSASNPFGQPQQQPQITASPFGQPGAFQQSQQPAAAVNPFGQPVAPQQPAVTSAFANPPQQQQQPTASPFSNANPFRSAQPPQSPATTGTANMGAQAVTPGRRDGKWDDPAIDYTQQEIEAFKASSFTMGTIPTVAPPQQLCV